MVITVVYASGRCWLSRSWTWRTVPSRSISTVTGIARFLVKQVAPHFQLYVTPINIDPRAQAAPVTYPAEFGAEIARDIGAFWTKGLPADVKAFDHKVINDEEYVGQAELILKERMALFDHQWSRFESGLFYFYVSSTDQDAHMLWRNMDPTHPKHAESDVRFAGWIPHLYEEMDRLKKARKALNGRITQLGKGSQILAEFDTLLSASDRMEWHTTTASRSTPHRLVADHVLSLRWARQAAVTLQFIAFVDRK